MKFPVYRQLDAMDCGPACLKMIAKYYGRDIPLDEIRESCYIRKTGVNLLGISDAADKIGFQTTGIKTFLHILESRPQLPCIIHWNQKHFIVLYKIKKIRKEYFFL